MKTIQFIAIVFVICVVFNSACAGEPLGTYNGKVHSDNYGQNAGTFNNWVFRADGTTEGQWTMYTSYAYPDGQQPQDCLPVYRFWSDNLETHFYTMDETEKNKLIDNYSHVWTYEGVAWYAYE